MNGYNLEKLKTHLEEYLCEVTEKSKGKQLVCPLCKSGTGIHKTGAFGIVPNTNNERWKCFSCGQSGTIIDLYAKLNNIDDKTSIRELAKKYENTINSIPQDKPKDTSIISKKEKEFVQERIISDIQMAQNNVDTSAYMLKRGILEDVLKRFNVGFIQEWIHPNTLYKQLFGSDEEKKKYSYVRPTPRVIIPTSENSYLARDIRPNSAIPEKSQGYTKMKVGETNILNLNALKNNKIVLVVEGEIDALSFISLGYETIGLGSTSMINQFIEKQYYNIVGNCPKIERPILVWALDNDDTGKKSTLVAMKLCKIHNIPSICVDSNFYGTSKDGNEAMINNRQGLIENINKVIKQAKNFNFNDIQEETNEQLAIPKDVDYIEQDFDKKGRPIYTVNAPLLAKHIRNNANYIFVRNEALEGVTRYWYENGVYNLISDEELKGHIKSYIVAFDERILRKKDVEEVFFNLTTDLKFVSHSQLNSIEHLINFKNGLLNLRNMELLPHDPNVYSTIQLDCNYNPQANDCPHFDKYLNDFTQGDQLKQQFLMEYLGGTFSNVYGYRYKKALFMVGESNSGKSTLKRFAEKIIGEKYISSATLEQLEARFGGTYIHNKRLIGSSDMPYASIRALDMFKALTGGDSISIEYKCKNIFSETFKGFLWFTMNKLPKLGGNQGNDVYNRIILFKCDNVIPDNKMDKTLDDKLFEEKESIINKCLQAFRNTINNNYNFTIPQESIIETEKYKLDNNIVALFYRECCIERPSDFLDKCTTKVMYDIFKSWCMDNNNGYSISNIEFRRALVNLLKVNDIQDITIRTHCARYYNFTLNLETKKDYIRIYGVDNALQE